MRRANPRRDPRGSGAKQSSTGRGSRNQTSDHKKRDELLIKSVQDGKISAMEEAGKCGNRLVVPYLGRELKDSRERSAGTEASLKPVPIAGSLLDVLRDWSRQAPYRQPGDWVFASPDMDGKQPYWPETMLKCYVHPAAKRIVITKVLGWHSFRRTFATLLRGGAEDLKTVQELMRHANSRLTLDMYAQALTPEKRAAHLKLVELIQPAAETANGPLWSHAEKPVAVRD